MVEKLPPPTITPFWPIIITSFATDINVSKAIACFLKPQIVIDSLYVQDGFISVFFVPTDGQSFSAIHADNTIYFLIHDRDSKFVTTFDTVFRSTGIHIIRTPFRAPNANAFAERWVRMVRKECLNNLIIVNQAHLQHVLGEYVAYYNLSRPHQGLGQQTPIPSSTPTLAGNIRSRKVLGGIIHDHYRVASTQSLPDVVS